MTAPSKTPRTDAFGSQMVGPGEPELVDQWAEFARGLERDLAAARHVRKIAEEQSLERAKRLDVIRKAVGAEDGETTEAAVERQIRCFSESVDSRRWIPVEERLPEDGQMVLGFLPATNQYPISMESLTYLASDAPDSVEAWLDWQNEDSDAPTHWMPLPEAPSK